MPTKSIEPTPGMASRPRVRTLVAGVSGAALLLSMAACSSESEPDADSGPYTPPSNIEIIVPFSPGGGADNSQRVFNEYASELTGTNMTIVNQEGAGGATGWARLAESDPDGETLAILTPPFSVIPPIVRPDNTGYTNDSFTYLCTYAVVPDTMYVRRDSGIETVDDLVAFAKANPGKVTVGTAGADGADTLNALLISEATGIDFTYVPFEGGAESLQGLLSKTVVATSASVGFIDSQKDDIIPLGITTEERSEDFPDVPTFKEQGYDVISERFRTFGGPAGLSDDVVDYWVDICEQVVADEDFRADLLLQGQPAQYLSSEETTSAIQDMAAGVEKIKDIFLKLQES